MLFGFNTKDKNRLETCENLMKKDPMYCNSIPSWMWKKYNRNPDRDIFNKETTYYWECKLCGHKAFTVNQFFNISCNQNQHKYLKRLK